jgi:SH3-like domain-containing protein
MCCQVDDKSRMGRAIKEGHMRTRAKGAAGRCVRLALWALVAMTAAAEAQSKSTEPGTGASSGSGLPVPRFVSLKSDRVNMRKGPGTDYPTAWVYRRAGLPLEVVKEFEGWRQVRDAEGAAGWVLQSFLSGRRTALVLPWDVKPGAAPPNVALRNNDSERARPVAMVEAGVIANISSCDGSWCRVSIDRFSGYIEQKKLWGVYEGEVIN